MLHSQDWRWRNRSQDSIGWPYGEVVCLGVVHISRLLNDPPTSLSEAVYSPGKWTLLPISAAHHAAFVLRQGLRLERV